MKVQVIHDQSQSSGVLGQNPLLAAIKEKFSNPLWKKDFTMGKL
jgi:hypothetical protein